MWLVVDVVVDVVDVDVGEESLSDSLVMVAGGSRWVKVEFRGGQ